MGADTDALAPTDASDPAGEPLRLVEGDGIAVAISHRAAQMPFAEKNADFHQIRFYYRGRFRLETELGALEVEEGDFVVIPKGLLYREDPHGDDNAVVIFETRSPVVLAEELWDSVGFSSFFVDYSRMVLLLMVDQIKSISSDSVIVVCAAGRAGLYLTTLATMLGLHIRVGTEDTIWKFPNSDELVESNLQLFEMARDVAALRASAGEYRELLRLSA
ncbi:MAG TPA: 3-keto-5-aminohexanoate cleavage protein [Solirubrobacterales bacterium]|nr:3-keto-5-aminohexanoate cleavage protein [Solirubrobacterales bacterium]